MRRFITGLGAAACVALLAGSGLRADDNKTPGVEVGAEAPDFTLKDQDGKERSLKELLKGGKVAVVFHRSARW